MSSDRAPKPDALKRVSADGKATALSENSQSQTTVAPPLKLAHAVVHAVDPKSGVEFVTLVFQLPPLSPGGHSYLEQLATRLRDLTPAIATGLSIDQLNQAADDLRNALQILRTGLIKRLCDPEGPDFLAIELTGERESLERRVQSALEQLPAPVIVGKPE